MTAPEKARVPVGYVRRAHGIRGAVLVAPLTDAPELRFVRGVRFSTEGDSPHDLTVTSVRPHREGWLLGFDGIVDRDAAEALRGELLTIARSERRRLGEDEYWEDELIGLEAVDVHGGGLGPIVAVVRGHAQDRLQIETRSGTRVEVPFVGAIVRDVLVTEGRVVVDAPEGLFEL